MNKKMFPGRRLGVATVSAWLLMSTVAVGRVEAQSLTILHHFDFSVEDSDGAESYAGLINDAAGNFYGTASGGGFGGGGIVFRLDSSGNNYTVLHYFDDGTAANDGSFPTAQLTLDSSGHLYGTTIYGGSAGGGPCSSSTLPATTTPCCTVSPAGPMTRQPGQSPGLG